MSTAALLSIGESSDVWTDRKKTPAGKSYPRSDYDVVPADRRPFTWSTPGKNVDGSYPEPWRVAHADRALAFVKALFPDESDLYTTSDSVRKGHQVVLVGLRDNRNKPDHRFRIKAIAAGLKGDGWGTEVASDGGSFWLVDDLEKDMLKESDRANEGVGDAETGKTILQQMGGSGRLSAMLGINRLTYLKNGLAFGWPSKQPSKGNYIEITLNAEDTYDVAFFMLRGYDKKPVKSYDGIYADGLKDVFERQTGLYLSLGGVAREDAPASTLGALESALAPSVSEDAVSDGPDPSGRNWKKRENPTRWNWSDAESGVNFTVTEKWGPGESIYQLRVLTDHGVFKHTRPGQWKTPEEAFKVAAKWFPGLAGKTIGTDMTHDWVKESDEKDVTDYAIGEDGGVSPDVSSDRAWRGLLKNAIWSLSSQAVFDGVTSDSLLGPSVVLQWGLPSADWASAVLTGLGYVHRGVRGDATIWRFWPDGGREPSEDGDPRPYLVVTRTDGRLLIPTAGYGVAGLRVPMQESVDEADAEPKGLKDGDILVYSWGYEQTNVSFFQVTAGAPVGKMATLRPIGSNQQDDGKLSMTGKSTPVKDKFTGPAMKKKVLDGYKGDPMVKLDYGYGRLWDGQPQRYSTYA